MKSKLSLALLLSVIITLLPMGEGMAKAGPGADEPTTHLRFLTEQNNPYGNCNGVVEPSPCFARNVTVQTLWNGTYRYYFITTDQYGNASIPDFPGTYGVMGWWIQLDGSLGVRGSANLGPDLIDIVPYIYGGDANIDNIVNSVDYIILRNSFGKGCGQPGYDYRSDFNYDCVVNSVDFLILKLEFGREGEAQW